MAKNPSTRWYFNDWMTDTALRACSVAARGLWMDCLAICAAAERPGYLEIAGKPCSAGDLAHVTGGSKRSVVRWLAELEERGVFSRDAEGAIFNRRMVKECLANVVDINGLACGKPVPLTSDSKGDIYIHVREDGARAHTHTRGKRQHDEHIELAEIGRGAACACERQRL